MAGSGELFLFSADNIQHNMKNIYYRYPSTLTISGSSL
jgi:hypothetical protein